VLILIFARNRQIPAKEVIREPMAAGLEVEANVQLIETGGYAVQFVNLRRSADVSF